MSKAASVTTHTILVAGRDIPLEIRKQARAKRMVLRWQPLREVLTITVPPRCSLTQVKHFVQEQEAWIARVIARTPERRVLEFGTVVPVLGEELRIVPAHKAPSGEGWLPILATPSTCAEVTQTVLKQRLKVYIGEVAEVMAQQLGVSFQRITVRDTVSRWGSCSSEGALSFSWRLIFAPLEVLDYVIAHEVAHLREHNHSPAFWAHVERLMPHYPHARRWLKQHGRSLYHYA